ncbi:MAG: hypothetical protein ACI37T_05880, partial [Candidatus Gastranaerophilaceae bacterium]
MKKIFFILSIVLITIFSTKSALAEYSAEQSVKFIYINGANNNTPSMQKWFYNGVYKLHPQMKHQFETSKFVNKYLLKSGKYRIEEEPGIFFWGDKMNRQTKGFING